LDCTCPVPHSGRSGCWTYMPGDRIEMISDMALIYGTKAAVRQ
jgi:hypothetical protein